MTSLRQSFVAPSSEPLIINVGLALHDRSSCCNSATAMASECACDQTSLGATHQTEFHRKSFSSVQS